jgi:hypothetical protein
MCLLAVFSSFPGRLEKNTAELIFRERGERDAWALPTKFDNLFK